MTLLGYVWKLFRAQWWISLHKLGKSKGFFKILWRIFSVLFLLGLAVGAFWLSRYLLEFLQRPEMEAFIGPLGLEMIPVFLLASVFLVAFLISFQVLLQGLYLSGDMDFLLSMPVPAKAVFIVKFLQAITSNLLLLGLFVLPLLWGLAAGSGYSWVYYPLALVLFVSQVLGAAGISAVLVMLIVRVFPARRVFEVIYFVGAILGMLCSQWYNLSQSFGGADLDAEATFAQALERLQGFVSPWIPITWTGQGLMALAEEQWWASAGFAVLGIGLTVGIFWGALYLSERLYYAGWTGVRFTSGRRPRARARAQARAERTQTEQRPATPTFLFLPSMVRGILVKDLRLLRRDLRKLSQLLRSVMFVGIYVVLVLFQGGGDAMDEVDPEIARFMTAGQFYMIIFLALVASWSLVRQLAAMSFSQEGKQYWILKSAPVRPGEMMLAKWLVAVLPGVVIGSAVLLIAGIIQGVALSEIMFGFLVVVFTVAGNAGLNLTFGVLGVDLAWSDPRQMMAKSSGCLALLAGTLFQGIAVVLFFAPVFVVTLFELWAGWGYLAGLILGGGFCTAVAFVPPLLVLKRIPTIGEVKE